jgi:hypothetical protein
MMGRRDEESSICLGWCDGFAPFGRFLRRKSSDDLLLEPDKLGGFQCRTDRGELGKEKQICQTGFLKSAVKARIAASGLGNG